MDINRASAEELQRAFEVDGERARYIVEKRNQIGGFETWDQVKEVVPSIEDKMVQNLRAVGITIGPKPGTHGKGKDGELLSQGSVSTERHSPGSGRNVNTVSREELERVCQIDGERANYFLRAREKSGGFRSWEQIKNDVPSFDEGMVERLKKAGYSIDSQRTKAA